MLIDVSDKIKIPIEIEQKILSRFIAMSERNISAIKAYKIQYDRDVICAIENYIGPSSAYYFYQELNSLFKQYEMVCYHSTKTIDENVIRSNGLTTNEWNTYSKNMVHTLQVLHVEEKDIVHIVEIIKCKYDWKYPAQGREPQLCFYSDRGLLSEDMYCLLYTSCRKVAGRGDTGHSEKSHLCGRYASAEDIYRNKVPICPQGKQRTEKPVSHQRQPSANRHT